MGGAVFILGSSAGSMVIASPQLVTGMLPENGGGLAIAVSASENHTAVLTGKDLCIVPVAASHLATATHTFPHPVFYFVLSTSILCRFWSSLHMGCKRDE